MKAGKTTSHEIVQQYLTRIATYEDQLHAALTVNPNALEEADALDRERAQGRIRGPLHGIPIALKDNIHTTNMPTTGGALAFDRDDSAVRGDADDESSRGRRHHHREDGDDGTGQLGAVRRRRCRPTTTRSADSDSIRTTRGAIRATLTLDGRPSLQTGGSSSGIGTAANFWAANVGTETSGSILSPSNQNMLAAIKPTVGRISRYGVIPITADQDTPGPMAKYGDRRRDHARRARGRRPIRTIPRRHTCTAPPGHDYTTFLKADGLKGARIGIPRASFYDPLPATAGGRGRGGLNPSQAQVMADAIAVLKAQGAIVIDPVDIPSIVAQDPKENFSSTGGSTVLHYGMKRDFNKWLASLGPAAPVKSLTELREWNTAHEKMGTIKYGQGQLDASDKIDLEKDKAKYEEDRARDILLAGTNGIDAAIKANNLDALRVSRTGQRRHRRQARLSDGPRAVRYDSQHARRVRRRRARRRRPWWQG